MSSEADTEQAPVPHSVLDAYTLEHDSLVRLEGGWINETWRAEQRSGNLCVLQRVNPIFDTSVQYDIDWLTRSLAAKGITTPTIVPTRNGALYVERQSEIWRALTYIDGESRESVENAEQASEAGHVLACFHGAFANDPHELLNRRGNVHDLERHLSNLRAAIERHHDHPNISIATAHAEEIMSAAASLPALGRLPEQIVHGDPKISNVLFERGSNRAICLVDLDTLSRMPKLVELADAFRSWCNPAGEDAADASFAIDLFDGAITGYLQAGTSKLNSAEMRAVPGMISRIAIELAARFCADALNEAYFGWQPDRFATPSDHNLARTRAQLSVAADVERQRDEIDRRATDASRQR